MNMDVFDAFDKAMRSEPHSAREVFYAGFASGARSTGTIWQQRGPWFITTFMGGLIGYLAHYIFH